MEQLSARFKKTADLALVPAVNSAIMRGDVCQQTGFRPLSLVQNTPWSGVLLPARHGLGGRCAASADPPGELIENDNGG
jgi:hypothetical protein